jgi:hypothetical protein
MTELLSAQGVFDKEQMFFIATDVVADDVTSSLLIFGTPLAGLAVRLYMPVQPVTADNVVTISIHGSLTEDGANIEGGMVYSKAFDEDIWDDQSYIDTIIPFTLSTDAPWAVCKIIQDDTDTITGLMAGIVLNHKAVDWTREPGWDITKSIPA